VVEWAAEYFRHRPRQRAPRLPFEFNHTSVPEFLSAQLTDAERRRIHADLAAACARWREMEGAVREYALRWLPTHWREAREWRELSQVLLDLEYLQAAVETAGVHAALREFREAQIEGRPEFEHCRADLEAL
jgi:hypothetical protein